MQQIVENLRYLLWKTGASINIWPKMLSQWLNIDESYAHKLIDGSHTLSSREVELFVEKTGCSAEEIQFLRLVLSEDILLQNIKYLFGSLQHGGGARFAKRLGVDKNTVSRWRTGKQRPPREAQNKIAREFGLLPNLDLQDYPLFLDTNPVTETEMKDWLISRINRMDVASLKGLFPALQKLMQ